MTDKGYTIEQQAQAERMIDAMILSLWMSFKKKGLTEEGFTQLMTDLGLHSQMMGLDLGEVE